MGAAVTRRARLPVSLAILPHVLRFPEGVAVVAVVPSTKFPDAVELFVEGPGLPEEFEVPWAAPTPEAEYVLDLGTTPGTFRRTV